MSEKLKADCILHGDFLLPMEEEFSIITDGAVAVTQGKIAAAGPSDTIFSRFETSGIIGGRGRAVMPGLINTHTHAAMVYFRGLSDDLPLKEWLENHIWPAESRWLSPEFISDATELACLEMLKAGITTYNDMYFFGDAAGTASRKMGMRAVLGVGILDFPTAAAKTTDEYFENAEDFVSRWKDDTLVTPCIAPHALYTCSPATLMRARALADRFAVPLHIHLSETTWEVEEITGRYGKRPVHHLEDLGFFDERVLAAHCVWLTDEEIEILARRRVGVSHCVESNLKLASGIAPVVKMLKRGVKVTFGTDGAASNNDLNILSEMSTAAKLHKAVSGDPTALNARTALLMATRWGAEALGLGSVTGSITPGKSADIVVLDLDKPHLAPVYDICSHIVYSVMASDVETVMVEGRVVIQDGKLACGGEQEIMDRSSQWSGKIRASNSH